MSIAFKAMQFSREAHKDQVRKYTGNPYADHLAEVAGIVATVALDTDHAVAVAWLHDCVEDQGIAPQTLVDEFGMIVTKGVLLLSDLETGNRAERKAASRARLAAAPAWVQTIKCADLISNTDDDVFLLCPAHVSVAEQMKFDDIYYDYAQTKARRSSKAA